MPAPRRIGRLARWPRLQRLAGWLRRTASPTLRMVHRLRQEQPGRLLQPFPDTSFDRHPVLFGFVRDALKGRDSVRILSFGCSTGEEPITLSRYLPAAHIDAFEINPRSLAIARERAVAEGCDRIDFHLTGDPPREGRYDAIFCMSVLRHGELDALRPESCTDILPFARFAATLAAFDRVLAPGGYLLIWGSNYRFADSPLADRYTAIPVPGASPHPGPVYGPDDRLIDCNGNALFVFRKDRAAG